ncbi:DUF4199 family protein [Aureisphaera sp. CAU 1614]|uniref:DUF4199 family protein n=1 Tax=Halomarinibacterium sedimenti TaxID=2857106 RepID=A0A9X1FLK9_9FLAO|nr:DUF4199 family protein [Halomarinibacterium sedimenti]MBW2936577.1 DUF4199 family protein [Halomarinibacterium sedimenti]
MTQNKNLPIKIGMLLGTALGIVVISIAIIRYKTGMIVRNEQTLNYVYWTIFALSVFFAVSRFRKLDPSSFSLRQTVKIGIFAGLLSGALYTIYIIILNNYIVPDLSSQVVEYYQQELASNSSELSKKDILDSIAVTELNPAIRGIIYIFVCMAFGALYSILSTIVLKRFHMFRSK